MLKFYHKYQQIPFHKSVIHVDGQGVIDSKIGGFYINLLTKDHDHETNPATSNYCFVNPATNEFEGFSSGIIKSGFEVLAEVYDNQVKNTLAAVSSVSSAKAYIQYEQYDPETGKNIKSEIWEFSRSIDYSIEPPNRSIGNIVIDILDSPDSQKVKGTVGCDYLKRDDKEYLFYGRFTGEGLTEICVAQKRIDDWVKWYDGSFSENGVCGRDTGLFEGYYPRIVHHDNEIYMLVQKSTHFEMRGCREFPNEWELIWHSEIAEDFTDPVYYPWIAGNWFYYCRNMSQDPSVFRFGLYRRRFDWQ